MRKIFFAGLSLFQLLLVSTTATSFMKLESDSVVVKPMSLLSESSLSCTLFDNLMQFDLSSLQNRNEGYYYKDGYFFNFCAQLQVTTEGSVEEAYVFKAANETETTYTAGMPGTPYTQKVLTSSKKGRIDELDASGNAMDGHIETFFENSVPCASGGSWQTMFEIYCDETNEVSPTSDSFNITVDDQNCQLTITTAHKAGCPVFSLQGVLKFLRSIPVVLALIMLFFGLACNFFGALIFKYISGAINGALIFINVFVIGNILINSIAPGKALAIVLMVLSIIIGLGLGYLLFRISKRKTVHGAAILFGFTGLFIGFLVYRFVLQHIIDAMPLLILTVIASSIGLVVLTWRHIRKLIVPLTAVIGSYLIVRGISIMIGGVPENFSMFGDSSNILAVFYYLLGYGLSIFCGYTFQMYQKFDNIHKEDCASDHEDEKEDENHEEKGSSRKTSVAKDDHFKRAPESIKHAINS
jgi:hypothetical protein